MLAAGMLQTNLRSYLKAKNIKGIREKTTLGILVKQLKRNNLLSRNGEIHFDDLTLKQNYLAHNLYGLFSKDIDETIIPAKKLVEMDVLLFREKAWALAHDFEWFSRFVAETDLKKAQLA